MMSFLKRFFTILLITLFAILTAALLYDRGWLPPRGNGPLNPFTIPPLAHPVKLITVRSDREWAMRVYPPRDATCIKAQLLFIHGIGLNSAWYGRLAEVLSKQGIFVLLVDLPGHGHSKGAPDHIFTANELLPDLVDIIHTKFDREKPLFLAAHSMGADYILDQLVLQKFRDANIDVTGLVALSPFVSGSQNLNLFSGMTSVNLFNYFLGRKPVIHFNWPRGIKDPLVRSDYDSSVFNLNFPHSSLQKRLVFANLPILMLQGAEDPLFVNEKTDQLFQMVRSSDKSFQWLKGVNHMNIIEKSVAYILTWISNRTNAC